MATLTPTTVTGIIEHLSPTLYDHRPRCAKCDDPVDSISIEKLPSMAYLDIVVLRVQCHGEIQQQSIANNLIYHSIDNFLDYILDICSKDAFTN